MINEQKRRVTPPFLLYYSMISAIISCLLIIISGYFKGKMDYVMFRDNNAGWSKKWKLSASGKLIKYNRKDWYYFGQYPAFKESFPYSSTLLVCFTDNWHRYQFIFLRCLYLAISIQMVGSILAILLAFVGFPVLYGVGFYYTFEKPSRKI